MTKFELAYLVSENGGHVFIPALLPKSEPDNIRPIEYTQLVKYEMRYRFLPTNILQKLMVRYYKELEPGACWDKGMMLKSNGLGQWALLDMGGGDDVLRIEVYSIGKYPASAMLNLVIDRMSEVNNSLSLKPEHYIVIDDSEEKPVEVNKLLKLKKRGHRQYQGDNADFYIDALLGEAFGDAAMAAGVKLENEYHDGDNIDMLEYFLREIRFGQRDIDDISRTNRTHTPMIYIDKVYNRQSFDQRKVADEVSVVVNNQSDGITELAQLLEEDLALLNKTAAEIQKTNASMASDLRDIELVMFKANEQGKDVKLSDKLIKYLSVADNAATVCEAIGKVCTDPKVLALVATVVQLII
jgi:hypothetical protein